MSSFLCCVFCKRSFESVEQLTEHSNKKQCATRYAEEQEEAGDRPSGNSEDVLMAEAPASSNISSPLVAPSPAASTVSNSGDSTSSFDANITGQTVSSANGTYLKLIK
ncbi:hypothetical protein A0J61_10602 [Choanephora cucurbitarum]|uniref:Uncharacterized protein n=1 Tax=Choanephora cucurbitarum TaxID=101091 RepID=A0A1C7MX50_9FUNG|nr:hypothetical protein A0J61_10602 [Choanephora cucurbitarum]